MKKMFVLLTVSFSLLMQNACTHEQTDNAVAPKGKTQQGLPQQYAVQNVSMAIPSVQSEKNNNAHPDQSRKIDNNSQNTNSLNEHASSDSEEEIAEIINDVFYEEKAEFLNAYNFILDIVGKAGS